MREVQEVREVREVRVRSSVSLVIVGVVMSKKEEREKGKEGRRGKRDMIPLVVCLPTCCSRRRQTGRTTGEYPPSPHPLLVYLLLLFLPHLLLSR